ncbi:N-acetylmuramoyl-L-alanine amidase [Patescibacteria group bacterium]|nr:N-acetylmuramoyl-L-alanine amidase [Patescibacteria group bacterium]
MKKIILAIFILSIAGGTAFVFAWQGRSEEPASELEFEAVDIATEFSSNRFLSRLQSKYPDLDNWQRPEGPLRVGLQVGHWKNDELPDELEKLRGVSTGTSGGGKTEVRVNLVITQETAKLLEAEGVVVDILPATIPQGYWADVFVAIHADGNNDTGVSGFKTTGPWRDFTGSSIKLVELIEKEYSQATGLSIDNKVTHSMRGYYAFNWWRYDYAVHPMTPAVILETGFLTSPRDQQIIIHQPEKAAQGIARAVLKFLTL